MSIRGQRREVGRLVEESGELPRLFQARVPGMEVTAWVEPDALARHGAMLFRGFAPLDPAGLEAVARRLGPALEVQYPELPASPGGLYRVTPYPPEYPIEFHNEGAHRDLYPARQLFYCQLPSPEGGQTPLVDGRGLRPDGTRLSEQGLLYRRRFCPGLDLSWQQWFGTEDFQEVERICSRRGWGCRWKGGVFEVQWRRPAFLTHPDWPEPLLFHQIFLHHPSLLPEQVRAALPDGPIRDVCYGDGSPLPDDWVRELHEKYCRRARCFNWRQGDLLIVDNRLVAHGRNPYRGERRLLVALAGSGPVA